MNRSLVPVGVAVVTLIVAVMAVAVRSPASVPAPAPAPTALPTPTLTPAPAPVDPINEALSGRDACLLAERDGRTVAAFRPDAALAPASTLKLLVGAAALDLLGPGHRFATEVVAAGPSVGGVVHDLWLVGDGDPMLVTPEEADFLAASPRWRELRATPLAHLADAVVDTGVRQVLGSVHGDASRHAGVGHLEAWPERFVEDGDITPLSALAVDGGWADREPRVVAPDPAAHAAAELTGLLRERGVTVLGEPKAAVAPADASPVARIEGAPLVDVLAGIFRSSHNPGSEMLLREVGTVAAERPGTTGDGAAAVARVLREAGVDTSGLALADGSGLSDASRLTCRTLVQALGTPFGGVLLSDLLAVAGRSGTLRHRYHDTPLEDALRAKTGWVRGVVGIAGVVDGPDPLTVALVQNGVPTLQDGRGVEDWVLLELVAPRRGDRPAVPGMDGGAPRPARPPWER